MGFREISRYDGTTPESWHQFTCGYCGAATSGFVVGVLKYKEPHESASTRVRWLACTNCSQPSGLDANGDIWPGAPGGVPVEGLPSDVYDAYEEARRCSSVNAWTACELVCRKILMHVAADKGAPEGDSFASYIDHLEQAGYITPPMKGWVDLIRTHANAATHKLPATDRTRGEGTLMFTAELLRIVYEMDALAAKYTAPQVPPV